MANLLQVSGQITLTNTNLRNVGTLTLNLTTTGSNNISNVMNVPTGSWSTVSQGSNGDFRWGYFVNLDLTSSVAIAISSSASVASYLRPGDWVVLTYSGSPAVYVSASGASSPALVQYIITEN